MKLRTAMIGITFAFLSGRSYAYNPLVHERITENAFAQATATIDFRSRLGINISDPIGEKTPQSWCQLGSVREDDILESAPPFRSLHHFYDPANGRPLTSGVWPICVSAVHAGPFLTLRTIRADSWALEPQLENSWGLPVARTYQRNALLGPNPGTRDQNLRYLFRSLGHIVHLVQDMAQPEHTRNDQHLLRFGATSADLYEKWTYENLIDRPIVNADAYFTGYQTVRLPSFHDYFHTDSGKGIADFSNRWFVTQDTNYHDEESALKCLHYDLPAIEGATPRHVLVTERPLDDEGIPYNQEVIETIYTSRPIDLYKGVAETDPYHTLLSAFDAETKKYDTSNVVYSLNDASYQYRAALLVPRAVGYSAGMIEHFFRGKIDAQWTAAGVAAVNPYELKITNRSAEAIGVDARISAAYVADPQYFGRNTSDDTMFILNDVRLADLVPGFSGLAPAASITLAIPRVVGLHPGDSLTEFERRIVIKGNLGSEEEAVIGLVQPPTPPATLTVLLRAIDQHLPVPSSTQLAIYINSPGGGGLRKVSGEPTADPQVWTAETELSAGSTFRVLLTHDERPGIRYFQLTVSLDGRMIDQISPGLYFGEVFVTRCLPEAAGAPPQVALGNCNYRFFTSNPFDP